MAFFEQFGKKITDAGQGVAKQTKNLADVARLNSAIAEEEKKISKMYANLGELYYNAHCKDAQAEGMELIEQINDLFAQIDRQREEIKQIKGVTKCPNCGADIPAEAAFCNACGAKVQTAAAQATPEITDGIRCKCGAVMPRGTTFCTQCGSRLEAAEGQTEM